MAGVLDRARESFADKAWGDAFAQLSAADAEAPLQPEDLERLAMAAYLTGRAPDCEAAWSRANHELLDRGDVAGGARCAFWLGFVLTMKGEAVLGGGWFARAQRLVDDGELDCAERGYLLVPLGLGSMTEGDDAGALNAFAEAGEIAERFADADLRAFAWCGRGGALVRLGELAEGLSLLDEVLVALTAGEVSSAVSGIVYCAAIETFQEAFDLRRAQEWTAALTQWCEAQPDLVPYRGNCLVHRVEIMCLRGAWPDALDEARRACELLTRPPQPAIGEAFYQRAELHRLRGELAEAEEAYSEANHLGRPPQPGLALLRLAQGQPDAADAAIRRVVDEASHPITRAKVLAAYVEIMLAVGDVAAARIGADELSEIAAARDMPLLHAIAGHAHGGALLAEGDAKGAYDALREAWKAWCALDAPHQAARARVLVGLACRELGDDDTSAMELDAARQAFQDLGAAGDLAWVQGLTQTPTASTPGGLTAREVEVLRLVASGRTNRVIAEDLFISERTVARHVSNIFTKLGLSSRSAATAFAYELIALRPASAQNAPSARLCTTYGDNPPWLLAEPPSREGRLRRREWPAAEVPAILVHRGGRRPWGRTPGPAGVPHRTANARPTDCALWPMRRGASPPYGHVRRVRTEEQEEP